MNRYSTIAKPQIEKRYITYDIRTALIFTALQNKNKCILSCRSSQSTIYGADDVCYNYNT